MSRLELNPNEMPQEEPESGAEIALPAESAPAAFQRLALPDEAFASTPAEERASYIDHLLRNAPLLATPVGFAERVVKAIKTRLHNQPNYRDGAGIVAALTITAFLVLPLLGLVVNIFFRLLTDANFPDNAANDIEAGLETLAMLLQNPTLLVVLVALIIPFLLLVAYVYRFWRGVLAAAPKSQD